MQISDLKTTLLALATIPVSSWAVIPEDGTYELFRDGIEVRNDYPVLLSGVSFSDPESREIITIDVQGGEISYSPFFLE